MGKLEFRRRPVLAKVTQQENCLGSDSAAGSPCQACILTSGLLPPISKVSVSLLLRPGAFPELRPRVGLQTESCACGNWFGCVGA